MAMLCKGFFFLLRAIKFNGTSLSQREVCIELQTCGPIIIAFRQHKALYGCLNSCVHAPAGCWCPPVLVLAQRVGRKQDWVEIGMRKRAD